MTVMEIDAAHMRAALGLARRGLGRVWPNPAVGCVIVTAQGDVVGRGRTQDGGRPHAETVALAQAGDAARGATAYVTLEPCAHTGATPPCADALVEADIARVVVATSDPDPRVNGAGISKLCAAGVDVETDCLKAEAEALGAGFLTRIRQGRPHLTLKLATSLDGRIATSTGESRWITGPDARRDVHLMRAQSDAVLVGAGTALADNPMLNVRDLGMDGVKPVRIVVTGALDLPRSGKLAATASEIPLWLCHHEGADPKRVDAWRAQGADLIEIPIGGNDRLDLAVMMTKLAGRGLTRVLCEGGGRLSAALINAGLVDELVAYTAGATLGAEGTPAIGPMGLEALADAPRFTLAEVTSLGGDAKLRWRRT